MPPPQQNGSAPPAERKPFINSERMQALGLSNLQ
jgi:hypothetical protein